MNKIKNEDLIRIAKTLQLNPTQEVLEGLKRDSRKIHQNLESLKSIDIENVEPMFRVDETPISFLREDIPGETFTNEQVLKNASTTKGPFITIKKVVQ